MDTPRSSAPLLGPLSLSALLCWCLVHAPVAGAATPALLFSDLDSGPAVGNGDTSGGLVAGADGAIVSVWGRFLGPGGAGSTIAVGGVAAARVFYWGPAVPPWSPADLATRHGLDLVVFEIPGATPAGATTITASVAGAPSNPLPFTVRSGAIRFVAVGGADLGDGSWARPWRTMPHAVQQLRAGDTCYVGDGVQQTTEDAYSACVNLPTNGGSGQPIALAAYPGARVAVGSAAVQRGFNDWAGTGYAVYWTIAKLSVRGEEAFASLSTGARIVGNHVTAPTSDAAEGTIEGSGNHLVVVGNELTGCGAPGCSKLYHPIYIESARAASGARYPTETDREIAWNYLHGNNANRGINIYNEGASSAFMTDHRVHHNWIEDQVGDGILIGGYVCGENWVHDNVVVHAGLGPEPSVGIAITHAGIQIDAGDAAYAGSVIHVWHNTVVDCGWAGASSPASSGCWYVHDTSRYRLDLRNNLTVSTGAPYVAGWSDAMPTVAGPNLWSGAGAAPTWDALGIAADPRFVAQADRDFRLAADSPAIDRGAALGAVVGLDFAATARPQGAGADLGAFESPFGGGATTSGGTTSGTTSAGTTTSGTTTSGTTSAGTTTSGTTTADGTSSAGGGGGHGHRGCGAGAALATLAMAIALGSLRAGVRSRRSRARASA